MLSAHDATVIFPIAYSYRYGENDFFCVPVRDTEPIPDFRSPVLCPAAIERKALSVYPTDAICDIVNGPSLASVCQACEGAWLYASGRVEHISGDCLAFWEHDRLPDFNAMLLNAIFPRNDTR